jgi:hypothetical protein
MQLADTHDMLGYIPRDRQDARNVLLAATRWLQINSDDWLIREARDQLHEALSPAALQPR